MSEIDLISPVDRSATSFTAFRMAARPVGNNALRLTLIDNGKPRARELMLLVADGLQRCGRSFEVCVVSKASASGVIDDHVAEEIANCSDLVLTGLGDCGACSACSLNDALKMELLGIPATVIISDAFTGHIAALAANMGAPGYPVAVVPHPVSSKNDDQLVRYAEAVLETVEKHLIDAADL